MENSIRSEQPFHGDPNSVANYSSFVTRHLEIDWKVDFVTSRLNGSVLLHVERVQTAPKAIFLDATHLEIVHVTDGVDGSSLPFSYSLRGGKFGGLLEIRLPSGPAGSLYKVRYQSHFYPLSLQSFDVELHMGLPKSLLPCNGLRPSKLLGSDILFYLANAILARSMLPCQDTPAVRATYSATVSVSAPLTVVMSANICHQATTGALNRFEFHQTTAIPSYLIAIAAGELVATQLGPRSHVWTEPELARASAYEFIDTEKFLSAAESLVGPYVWGIYDLLVLPPSFPYGGMENPCLTFITPSLLAGDRSLVSVIAHEIAHSWTGNLVSCRSWEHFWLNEGFTKFLERKILGKVYGESWRQFTSIIGAANMREAVQKLRDKPSGTRLVTNNTDVDPEDYFSAVPYEKGYTFLYYLEEHLGGVKVFEPFFAAFIQKFKHQSIESNQFKWFAINYFSRSGRTARIIESVDWDTWFYGEGLPPVQPCYDDELMRPCHELADSWLKGDQSQVQLFDSLMPGQKVMFLDLLLLQADMMPLGSVSSIYNIYDLGNCKNAEIMLRFYMLAARSHTQSLYSAAASFAIKHGRVNYCKSIYGELFRADELGRELALKTFNSHREFYHPVARSMIAKELQLS